jgi:hypothetical protein
MKLTEKKNHCEVYKSERGYEIVKREALDRPEGFWLRIHIKDPNNKYLPGIYEHTDSEGQLVNYFISTTHSGNLTPEEIKKVITGYEIALKTIEEIRDYFNITV